MAALINGQAYDYTQIIINILDVPVIGVSAINYTVEQDKVNNFGTGNDPVSRGKGAKNASGSLEISMNDIEAIRDAVSTGDLLDIPSFDILVIYGNPQKPVVHTLKNCEFLNDGVEATQGDTDIKRTFDIVLSHVDYGR